MIWVEKFSWAVLVRRNVLSNQGTLYLMRREIYLVSFINDGHCSQKKCRLNHSLWIFGSEGCAGKKEERNLFVQSRWWQHLVSDSGSGDWRHKSWMKARNASMFNAQSNENGESLTTWDHVMLWCCHQFVRLDYGKHVAEKWSAKPARQSSSPCVKISLLSEHLQ
jgi:hypothetical protein